MQNFAKSIYVLLALAAVGLLPAMGFYYVGEEAIFPISSLEMWQHDAWLKQYLYGVDVQHNPLFNWLIMGVSALAGWKNVLIITRALTITATLSTALTLFWLARRLFQDRIFAAFAALSYLTMADVLLYHGWLCYVDALFALFIFAAIAMLWVGTLEHRAIFVAIAVLALTAAFLSKAFTAYIFYGTAAFVLLFDARQRTFLLSLPVMLFHVAALAAPFVWFALIPSGHAQGGRMFAEILYKLSSIGIGAYLGRLVAFPAEVFVSLLPLPLLAAYFWLRRRNRQDAPEQQRLLKTACWITVLSFLPYWLSPQGGMRYLLPIYPVFALVCARVIWQSGEGAIITARKWIAGIVVVQFVAVLLLFPYYQSHYRGKNYDEAAADILAVARGHALYSTDVSSAGLSVTGYIDQRIYPAPALQWPPAQWQSGFVLARTADAALGEVYKKYPLGGDELYLLCRGEACAKPAQP